MRFSSVIWQFLQPSLESMFLKKNVAQACFLFSPHVTDFSSRILLVTYLARCFVGLQDTVTSKGILTALTVIYRIV